MKKLSCRFICIAAWVVFFALMFNVNAMVDIFIHPEIPYFDKKHLIVGSVTSVISSLWFGLLMYYVCLLKRSLKKNQVVDSFLSICSFCKRVRNIDLPSRDVKSWREIESFLVEKTNLKFSHSICPDCIHKFYSQFDNVK